MAEFDGDKSQEATPHRRQQAREEGHVAKSQDLASAALLVLGIATLLLFGGALVDTWSTTAGNNSAARPGCRSMPAGLLPWNKTSSRWPRGCCRCSACCLPRPWRSTWPRSGFLFLPEKLAPDFTRLDPVQGLAAIFSLPSVMRLAFGLLKLVIVAAVAGVSLYNQREADSRPEPHGGRPDRPVHGADPALDGVEGRRGPACAGDFGLRLSTLEVRSRPADDAAGDARGNEEPGRQSADDRAAAAGAAAAGDAPPVRRRAQGRRGGHQPDGVGRGHPIRARRPWPRRSWWPRGRA